MLEKIKADLINLITSKMNNTSINDSEKWNYINACYHLYGHYEVRLTEIEDEDSDSGYGGGEEEFEQLKIYVGYFF